MKILIFNFEYPPLGGGGGVATRFIAEGLAANHEVHVITSRPSHKFSEWVDERDQRNYRVINGVTVHRVPVWGRKSLAVASLRSMVSFVPSAWWRARQLVVQEKFDVINAQFVIPSGLPAALIARAWRIPMLLSFIGGDLFDPTKGVSPHRHWILRKLIRLVAAQANHCTAISNDTKRRAVELHKVTNPITVINLGINPSGHNGKKTREQLGLPDGVLLFVALGRLIPRKGYDCMIEALAHLNKAHLAIIGDGPLLQNLKEKAYNEGVQDRVHWLGYVGEEDKINILDQSDVFMSASEHEGFGIVFLEAMESGLPIVATWEGGQTDFLKQDVNACLVRPKDSLALAGAMKRIIEDKVMARRMGVANRKAVQFLYWPQVVKKYEVVLMGCIEKNK